MSNLLQLESRSSFDLIAKRPKVAAFEVIIRGGF